MAYTYGNVKNNMFYVTYMVVHVHFFYLKNKKKVLERQYRF